MSIKLLPASVNPVDPSQSPDASISLVPLTQRAISARAGQTSLVPSDAFAWSSPTRGSRANVIDEMAVEDSRSDETGVLDGEYVSGWAGSRSVERTAVANYLFYAASRGGQSGRLIDVYA